LEKNSSTPQWARPDCPAERIRLWNSSKLPVRAWAVPQPRPTTISAKSGDSRSIAAREGAVGNRHGERRRQSVTGSAILSLADRNHVPGFGSQISCPRFHQLRCFPAHRCHDTSPSLPGPEGALYAGSLSSTMAPAERVRPQFLSLRHAMLIFMLKSITYRI